MSYVILIEKLKFEEGELTGFYLEPSIDFDIKWGIFDVKIIMYSSLKHLNIIISSPFVFELATNWKQ